MVSDFSEIDWEWNDATNCHMESFDWVKLWDFFAAEIAMDFHRMFNISGIELSKGMNRRQLDGTFLAWHFLSETMVLFPISIFLHQFSAENHPKGGSFLSVCQASWLWCPGSKWSQETLLRLCTLVCSQTWLQRPRGWRRFRFFSSFLFSCKSLCWQIPDPLDQQKCCFGRGIRIGNGIEYYDQLISKSSPTDTGTWIAFFSCIDEPVPWNIVSLLFWTLIRRDVSL